MEAVLLDPFQVDAAGQPVSFDPKVASANRRLIEQAEEFILPGGTRIRTNELLSDSTGKPAVSVDFSGGGYRIVWVEKNQTIHGCRLAGVKAMSSVQN